MTRFTYRQRLALQALAELGRKHGVGFVVVSDRGEIDEAARAVVTVDGEAVHTDVLNDVGVPGLPWSDRLERRLSS